MRHVAKNFVIKREFSRSCMNRCGVEVLGRKNASGKVLGVGNASCNYDLLLDGIHVRDENLGFADMSYTEQTCLLSEKASVGKEI